MFVKMDILLSFVPSTATPFFRSPAKASRALSLNDKSIPCKSHKALPRAFSAGFHRAARAIPLARVNERASVIRLKRKKKNNFVSTHCHRYILTLRII